MPRIKKRILYVDGYNIINCWEDLKSLMDISLEEAREDLISVMKEFQALSGIELIVVFDSYKSKHLQTIEEKRSNITVVFTKEFETADSYIERACHLIARDEHVRVATSDNAIQNIALGSGATRISARELKIEYENLKEFAKEKEERKVSQYKRNLGGLSENQIEELSRLKLDLGPKELKEKAKIDKKHKRG